MKLVFVYIFILFATLGCSSKYIIDQADSEDNISKLNYLSQIYTCKVELIDGTHFSTKFLEIKNDSLYYKADYSDALSVNLINRIELRDIWQGFFDGLFLGLPIGTASLVIGINLVDAPLKSLLYAGIAFISTIVVNLNESHMKHFVFQRNIDNSFTYYIK